MNIWGYFCTGDQSAEKLGATRLLRQGPAKTKWYKVSVVVNEKRRNEQALLEKRRTLFALAREMGFCLEHVSYYRIELTAAVTRRLQTRWGQHIYQNSAFSLPGFPSNAAQSILPNSLLTEDVGAEFNTKTLTWRANTVSEV